MGVGGGLCGRPWQQSQRGSKMSIKINILNKNIIFWAQKY